MRSGDRTEETEALLKRHDVLERLSRSPAHVRDLVEEMDHSRSTINRAITELEGLDFVERGDGGIEATPAGHLAADRLRTFFNELDDIYAAKSILAPLQSDTLVSTEFVAGSEPTLATGPAPYQPLEQVHDTLAGAEEYRALVPAVNDSRYVRLLYENVVTQGNPAELVVTPTVFETLREEFPRQMTAMAESDGFSVFVGSTPQFGLGLCKSGSSVTEAVTTAHVVVPNESGGVHGLLVNDSDDAVAWASEQFQRAREGGVDRTDDLVADSDGGIGTRNGRSVTPLGRSLPLALEREGFVSVDRSYFRDEPVADPATAWRAGLSLAEVHTGYAFRRTVQTDDGDADLATMVSERLTDGRDCVVLGPPGSGKSTTCKQVATDWYDANKGPVLYRESDRGRPFSAVDELVSAVSDTDGHTLIVVEDAVRPDAAEIFDALDRFDNTAVSVLLDAREVEWREYDPQSSAVADRSVVHVPPLSENECATFVDHFERTAGRPVEVSTDELWSAVSEDAARERGTPHEMLRLIHRLAAYTDPLQDGPTALEETVAAVYEDVRNDDIIRSRAVLINVVNAAGLDFEPGLLYAGVSEDRFDAVDGVLDHLNGTLVFSQGDGRYRTVHETWSTTFLSHLVTAEGEQGAARLFARVVSSLFALADDEQRERIVTHLGDDGALGGVSEDPQSWADSAVEAIYTMGRGRPALAPLYGDGAAGEIDLPSSCSDEIATERLVWVGDLFLAGGYDDRAAQAFHQLPEDPEYGPERLLGLARVAHRRDEYDAAISRCRECLSLVGEDRPTLRARARLHLGETLAERGENDQAKSAYQTALSDLSGSENRRLLATVYLRLGSLAAEQSAFDQATDWHETALDIARELDDRITETEALGALGKVAIDQSAFDRATRLLEQTLDLQRALGHRRGEAETLNNLGIVVSRRGNQKRARKLFERCIEHREQLGDHHDAARTRHSLGIVFARQGEYDRACELFERSLETKRELGDRRGEAKTLLALGNVYRLQGDYERSREQCERALELKREQGDRHGIAMTQFNLGGLARREGNYERAGELYSRCRDVYAELGDPGGESKSIHNLATIATKRGEYDRAERLFERSLEMKREMGDRPGEAQTLHQLGFLATRRGEFQRGQELADRSRALAEEVNEQPCIANALVTLGINALARDDDDQAREHAKDALTLATEMGEAEPVGSAKQLLVELAIRDGAYDRAAELLSEAGEAVADSPAASPETRFIRAKLALAKDDYGRAFEHASAVAEEFERLGVPYWLARSKRLLGRIATEDGDPELAREHYLAGIELFESLDSAHDALVTLELLLELPTDGGEAEDEYAERARRLLSDAPAAVTERHEQRFSDLVHSY